MSFTNIGPVVSLIGCAVMIGGCGSGIANPSVQQKTLEDMVMNVAVPLTSMVNHPVDHACIMYPYQERLADNDPTSSKVDKYLGAVNYAASESQWALVLVKGDDVTINRFKRSSELDVFPFHKIEEERWDVGLSGFRPVVCASGKRASLIKVTKDGRTYILFGDHNDR